MGNVIIALIRMTFMVAILALFFFGLAYLTKKWVNQDLMYYCLLVGNLTWIHAIAADMRVREGTSKTLAYSIVVFSLAYCIGVGHVLYTFLQTI